MLRQAVVMALLLGAIHSSNAAPPSVESLDRLIKVTESEQLLASMQPQLDAMINRSIQSALKGRTPTAAQQQALDRYAQRVRTILDEELAWPQLRERMLRIYADALTQEEVDGMLAFYATPAGQAVIKKMPRLMQTLMADMQQRMTPMIGKVEQASRELARELREADAK